MVPEGLEWASAEDILEDIASVGFNYIRMYVCCSKPIR
jgi:endoglucanase